MLGALAELKEAQRERLMVQNELQKRQKQEEDLARNSEGAGYKVQIARWLRQKSMAGNPWMACRLNMRYPCRITHQIRDK